MNLIEREFCDNLSILTDFKDKPRFLVAFSGGIDSLALLALTIKAVGKSSVFPVYVNHHIRSEEELKKEIDLNIKNCSKLDVPLKVCEIDKGLINSLSKDVGTEAAARKLRYEILEKERTADNCDFILTAHHKDDQIETIIMKVISHAPVTGLRGVSEVWGRVLRPLLEFSKIELESYVKNLGLQSSYDSTNSDNRIKRNEVRNVIIPELKEMMPDYEFRLLRLRSYALKQCKEIEPVDDSISISVFNLYNDAQKMMVLYMLWDNVIGTSMPQTLAKRVFDLCKKNECKLASANGGIFYAYNGTLYLINEQDIKRNSDFVIAFDGECGKFRLPYNLIIERKKNADKTDISIDPSLFSGSPVIRFARDGEVIKLKDGSKTVNKLLQDMKVPRIFRNMVPVIADDEGLCVVFGTVFGGRDRICVKMRSPLALDKYYKYICYKGNFAHEKQR